MRFRTFTAALAALITLIGPTTQAQTRDSFLEALKHYGDLKAERAARAKTWPQLTATALSGMLNSWSKGIGKSSFDLKSLADQRELSGHVLFASAKDYNRSGKTPKQVFGLLLTVPSQKPALRSWVLFNRKDFGYVRALDALEWNPAKLGYIWGGSSAPDDPAKRLENGLVEPIDLMYDALGGAWLNLKQVNQAEAEKLGSKAVSVTIGDKKVHYSFTVDFS